MVKVKVYNNEFEEAFRKWKRLVKKDGTLVELKKREYYVKPGIKKRLKHEAAVKLQNQRQKKIEAALARQRYY